MKAINCLLFGGLPIALLVATLVDTRAEEGAPASRVSAGDVTRSLSRPVKKQEPEFRTRSFRPAEVVTRSYRKDALGRGIEIVERDDGSSEERPLFQLPILFEYGADKLKGEVSRINLEEAGRALRGDAFRGSKFEIQGHTCSRGSEKTNQRLSEARARRVLELLVKSHRVPRDRIVSVGYGEKFPAASNDSEEGRQQNRRVVIVRVK